jgi:hypothetical protein
MECFTWSRAAAQDANLKFSLCGRLALRNAVSPVSPWLETRDHITIRLGPGGCDYLSATCRMWETQRNITRHPALVNAGGVCALS